MPATPGDEGKAKRNLVRWDDDKDKQLLLCMQYACNKAGIRIPWDSVAKQMGDKFSGGACVQHLAKLRNRMAEENIPVPPPLPRGLVTSTPSRVYAKRAADEMDLPDIEPLNRADDSSKPATKKRKATKKDAAVKEESDHENIPDLYDSDADYGATPTKAAKNKPKKGGNTKKNTCRKSIAEPADEMSEPTTPTSATRTRGIRVNYAQFDNPLGEDEAEDVKPTINDEDEPASEAEANVANTAGAVEEDVKDEEAAVAFDEPETVNPKATVKRTVPQQVTPILTPASGPNEQHADTDELLRRTHTTHNPTLFNFQDMGNNQTIAGWAPQYGGYNAPVNSFAGYNMNQAQDQNRFASNNGPSGFMWGTGQGLFQNNFENNPAWLNSSFQDTHGLHSTPTSMGRNTSLTLTSPFGVKDPMSTNVDDLMTAFDPTADHSTSATRTNSKESIEYQDSLKGFDSLTSYGGGEELDMSSFGAGRFDDDNEMLSFLDFDAEDAS